MKEKIAIQGYPGSFHDEVCKLYYGRDGTNRNVRAAKVRKYKIDFNVRKLLNFKKLRLVL